MKNAPRPNLSHVDRRQPVLVWLRNDKKIVQAVVQGVRHGEVRVRWSTETVGTMQTFAGFGLVPAGVYPITLRHRSTYSVKRRDEGVTWVRGWTGEEADAFQVLWAMAAV